MTQEIYLVNDTTEVAYHVSNLSNLNWKIDTPVTPMPLPEDTHDENILVKMEGNTAKMDLSWTLVEGSFFGTLDSNNVFDPNPSGSGATILNAVKQIVEFKDFVPKSIGDKYSVRIIEDGVEIMRDNGTISNMGFSVSGGSPIVWSVNVSFYVGNVVAMLDADIPNAPTSVTLVGSTSTGTNAGTISFTMVPYDGFGAVPTGASITTGVKIKYKIGNDTWEDATILNAHADLNVTNPNSITGIIRALPHGDYRVKIAQINGYSSDAGQEYYRTGSTSTSSTVVVG
mgnify:CR=1 FL=1